jgi:hypothetical protein
VWCFGAAGGGAGTIWFTSRVSVFTRVLFQAYSVSRRVLFWRDYSGSVSYDGSVAHWQRGYVFGSRVFGHYCPFGCRCLCFM